MPVRKKNVCYSFIAISSLLSEIRGNINKKKFEQLNLSNRVDVSNINKRIDFVRTRLNKSECERVKFGETGLSPKDLRDMWHAFNDDFLGEISEDIKESYGRLLKETLRFLEYIKCLPESSFLGKNEANVRIQSQEIETIRLEQLRKRRAELRKQYEQALNEVPQNQEKIQLLKERFEALGGAVVESRKTIENIQTDADEEQRIKNRIDSAFDELKRVNNLDIELRKLRYEYYVWLGALVIVTGLFLAFYV